MQIRPTNKGVRLLQKGRHLRIAYLASHLKALAPAELEGLDQAAEILKGVIESWL